MENEQLLVMLEARINQFEKEMRNAERRGTRTYTNLERDSRRATARMEADMRRSTGSINRALATTQARIGAFGKAFAGGLVAGGASVAIGALAKGVRQATADMAALGDEAKRAGVSVQAFQELKFVAEQNRVGIDALVDGLKELSLRADEFVVTGKGSGADAFKRLGYEASDLKRRLQEPDQLFLDIIGRMDSLDKAAQIRVADEVFGGTGGEKFVQLLDQGEAKLRATVERAHEVGAVMDSELIEKAAELDRRWQVLETRVGNFGKTLAVGLADAIEKMATLRTDLDDIFATLDQARGQLGPGVADGLDDDSAALAEHRAEVEALRGEYFRLGEEAAALAAPLYQTASTLAMFGETDAAGALTRIAGAMIDVSDGLDDGSVSADRFEAEMADLAAQATAALGEVSAIDTVQFGGVTSALNGFIERLGAAITRARELRAALPGASPDGSTAVYGEVGARGDPRDFGPVTEPSRLAPSDSRRPRQAPVELGVPDPPKPKRPGSGGGGRRGGGGGGRAARDPYGDAVAGLRSEIREMEAETAALVVLVETGRDVGDALDFARTRAKLLAEAQEAGKAVTPELTAEIDALAESYARAGQEAEDAADRMQKVQTAAEGGARRMSDLFGSILDGSMKAKDAIGALLMEIAKTQLLKGFKGLANGPGGGFFAGLGSLLGFSSGGWTGNGREDEIAGVVHGREGVLNARAMRLPGAHQMMNAMNRGVLPATSGGSGQQKVDVQIKVTGEEGPMFRPVIEATATQAAITQSQATVKAYDGQMPARVRGINKHPRRL